MYLERLVRDYDRPKAATTLLLMPSTQKGPMDKVDMRMELANADRGVHVCLYCPPYGLVPSELADAFPFMHTEVSGEPDAETIKAMAETVRIYLASKKAYKFLIVVHSNKRWQARFARLCGRICRRMDLRFSCHSDHGLLNPPTEKLGDHRKQMDKAISN
jgi:predicted RNA-binding protein